MKQRIRIGDLVEYYYGSSVNPDKRRTRRGLIQGTSRDWYCANGYVDIDNTLTPIKNIVRIVARREKVKDLKLEVFDEEKPVISSKKEKKGGLCIIFVGIFCLALLLL